MIDCAIWDCVWIDCVYFAATRNNGGRFVLFYRANIDEVESEVVEIEAKLDKVRDFTKYVSITVRFPIWSDPQIPVFHSS